LTINPEEIKKDLNDILENKGWREISVALRKIEKDGTRT